MTTTLWARQALVDGPDGLVVRPTRVTVSGPRITAVEPADAPAPDDDDVGELLLTPALVDVHTHLALVALRGLDISGAARANLVEDLFFDLERRLTAEDVYAFARVGAWECLLHGTGFVSDHYYFADAVARAMQEVGLTGLVAPTLQDLGGPGVGRAEAGLALTEALDRDGALAAAGIGAALGPHAVDTVSDGLWRQIAAAADRLDLPVHAHAAQSWDEVRRVHARGGRTPVDHLRALGVLDAGPAWALVHALYLTDADLAALDPARHLLVVCPSSQAQFGFVAAVDAWDARGAWWAAATDCAASNDSMAVGKELRAVAAARVGHLAHGAAFAAFRASGALEDAQAIHDARSARWSATDGLGAPGRLLPRVLGAPGRLHPRLRAGALAPGHLANLALWDVHHPTFWPGTDPLRALAYGDPSLALRQVMTAGVWRSARGSHAALADDPRWLDARREAEARLARLLSR